MTIHPEADLSAYADDALDTPARAAVEAHLDTCAVCRAHLADLRAVSRLLRSLPAPAPRRSLVPRLVRPPVWLAPSRTFATFASGVFAFLFLVSSVLIVDPTLGGGGPGIFTTGTQRSAAQRNEAGRVVIAPVAAAAVSPRAPAAAPLAPQAAAGVSPPPLAAPAAAPRPSAAADSAQADAAKSAITPAPPRSAPGEESGRPTLGSPFLWLALTLGAALIAVAIRRRMRLS